MLNIFLTSLVAISNIKSIWLFPISKTFSQITLPYSKTQLKPVSYVKLNMINRSSYSLVIEKIQKQTKVPVLMPEKFKIFINNQNTNHGNIDNLRLDIVAYPNSYTFCIPIKFCIGGIVINKDIPDGYKVYQSTVLNSDKNYICSSAANRNRKDRSGFVKLSRGIQGFYYEPLRTVYCGHSEITWRQGSYQYSVSLKLGEYSELVNAANSAIDNQP